MKDDRVEGIIIEVNDEIAKVKLNRHNNCSNCGMCQGADAVVLDAPNTLGTEPGQKVILEIKETNMFKAACIIFILPLIAVATGLFLGYYISSVFGISNILPMIIGAVAFGLLAVMVVKWFDKSLESTGDKPKIVKLIK